MDAATTSTPKKGAVPANWPDRFLTALAKWGNVSAACKAARVSRDLAYDRRKADPGFAAAWETALNEAVEGLEQEAWRRAAVGTVRKRPIYYQGDKVGEEVVRDYSDTLLIFLLKANAPDKYRETVNINVSLRREAERLAAAYGLAVEDVIAEAEHILAEGR